jgi:hypothetical protein
MGDRVTERGAVATGLGGARQGRRGHKPLGRRRPAAAEPGQVRPDCLGMRMRLQDGSTLVMPLGRLTTKP